MMTMQSIKTIHHEKDLFHIRIAAGIFNIRAGTNNRYDTGTAASTGCKACSTRYRCRTKAKSTQTPLRQTGCSKKSGCARTPASAAFTCTATAATSVMQSFKFFQSIQLNKNKS
jgi:hypothetical protein